MLACVATATAAIGFQVENKPDVVVQGKYVGEDGRVIEGLGVCKILPDEVSCWNLKGEPAPDLADKVRSYYLGNNSQEVQFSVGKENRYLLVRESGSNYGSSYRSSGNQYLQATYLNNSQDSRMQLLHVATDQETASIDIVTDVQGVPPVPLEIPFQKGQITHTRNSSIEIGEYKPAKLGSGLQPNEAVMGETKTWAVILSISGVKPSYNFTPLGKDDKPISFVDRNGEPISDIKYLASLQPIDPTQNPYGPYPYFVGPQQNQNSKSKFLPERFAQNGPQMGDAATFYTNINPQQIKALKLTVTVQRHVLIQGFPLDPK